MVRVVQASWDYFSSQYGVSRQRATSGLGKLPATVAIPFEHPDVRVIIDTMFLEGTLQPIGIQRITTDVPEWAKVGLVTDKSSFCELVAEGVRRIANDLPELEASYRDWTDFACRLGEVLFRFHSLSAELAEKIAHHVRDLQREADDRLKDWVFQHFADLPSLPIAKGPVMVHHVPRYLALRRRPGEDRIALLVFDGLAIDQWVQIRERLTERVSGLTVEEGACFAWLPTLTSVSRQAVFSGLKPREFADSIRTTAREPSLWTRFWQENGLSKEEVFYQKGLKRTTQLACLEAAISNPRVKVAGLVVDMVDEIVPGAMLGKRGITSQISEWCETGFVEKLFFLLAEHGYQIYLTADHGNVEANGIGRINQGAISELRGERVRIYRSEALAGSIATKIEAFHSDLAGLPPNFLPLYADTRRAFVPKGEQIVAHGGISVEELIVPFVKVTVTRGGT